MITKASYLRKFRRCLRGLRSEDKQDIIREVQESFADFSGPDSELIAHFGTPQKLAAEYLQDREITLSPFARGLNLTLRWGGFGLAAVGGILVLGVGALFVLYMAYVDDKYDYSSTEAAQRYWEGASQNLNLEIGGKEPLKFEAFQSEFIVHGVPAHETSKIICYGEPKKIKALKIALSNMNSQKPVISHMNCSAFIAAQPVHIENLQTTVVINNPSADVFVSGKQATVKLAVPDDMYHIQIESGQIEDGSVNKSNIPHSNPKADIRIDLRLSEANLKRYVF